MKVLLDENLPHRLRPLLAPHDVYTVQWLGWGSIRNGQLLLRAADEGFDVLVTVDAGLEYQQNLTALPVAVIVIHAPTNAAEHVEPLVPQILAALSTLTPKTLSHVPSQ